MPDSAKIKLVFIAGAVHSGTTLLGSIVGSSAGAVYVGEIKQYARRLNKDRHALRVCTCGSRFESCPFWGDVEDNLPPTKDLNVSPGFSWANLRLMSRLLSPFGWRGRRARQTDYGLLVEAIRNAGARHGEPVDFVVDTSRSIRHLDSAALSENLELYVVQVVRDGTGVVDSIRARGYSAFYGIATWWLVNIFLNLYLERTAPRLLRIQYERLCGQLPTELRRLNEFLGTRLDARNIVDRINEKEHHLMWGNRGMRKTLGSGALTSIRQRTELDHLTAIDRWLTRILVKPFQRFVLERFFVDKK